VCGGMGGCGGVGVYGCGHVVVWGCRTVGVWWCGGGWFPLAFEHSKVCTLCDFGHLQFFNNLKITELAD
jgi:hypothetical protein